MKPKFSVLQLYNVSIAKKINTSICDLTSKLQVSLTWKNNVSQITSKRCSDIKSIVIGSTKKSEIRK